MGIKIVRKTRSVCPVCRLEVPAEIIRLHDKIIMSKRCPVHQDVSAVISSEKEYFEKLTDSYFALLPLEMPLRILELAITPKCGMDCLICSVMSPVERKSEEMDVEDIKKIIKRHPSKKIVLWGLEPTENRHLEGIIRYLSSKNKKPFLFTNGVRIADCEYLKRLKKAGLKYVYLQFDGFDDRIYRALRNQNLLENKLAALQNLKGLHISTALNVTLAKGINENQIDKIIDYAVKNSDFIRQVGFLPLIRVGKADNFNRENIPQCHEFLKIIETETSGKINLDDLRAFQKLMYVVYRFTNFRRCFWFTLYILFQDKKAPGGYYAIGELIDLKAVEHCVDRYVEGLKNKRGLMTDLILLCELARCMLNFRTLLLVLSGIRFILSGKKVEDARFCRKFIFITCTDFCDLYKMDLDMSDNYCEEILANKDKAGNITYEPTYRMMINH